MKKLSGWALAGVLALTTLACDTSTAPDPAPDPGTLLGVWQLTAFETTDGVVVPPNPANYTIEFRDDGRAHIKADCNVCNGGYDLRGESLSLGLLACTLAACQPSSLDDEFREALGSVSRWQRGGNELALDYAGGVLRFDAP